MSAADEASEEELDDAAAMFDKLAAGSFYEDEARAVEWLREKGADAENP